MLDAGSFDLRLDHGYRGLGLHRLFPHSVDIFLVFADNLTHIAGTLAPD